ncbi:MAG: site-specific integrase [Campylobacterota bacterium]|nr:site-specific integrase [Campylobacterota bacterium]
MSRVKLRINKTKKGTEFLGVDFLDNNGNRQRKSLGLENTPENKKRALNVIIPKITLKLEENKGEFFKNKLPTVYEFALKSISMHKSERKEDTHKDYLGILNNHIKDILGSKRIDEVKASDIKQWQTDLIEIKGLSASRVKTCRKVLNMMYSDAMDDDLLEKSPLSRVSAPTIIAPEIQPFTPEEALTIIHNAQDQIQNFVALAFFTGARSGEMLGLKWEDIDFARKEITIKRSIKMGKVGKTKTPYSVRTIDMIDSLVPFLESQYQLTGSKKSYVFLNRDENHIYDIKRIRDTHWKKLLRDHCTVTLQNKSYKTPCLKPLKTLFSYNNI